MVFIVVLDVCVGGFLIYGNGGNDVLGGLRDLYPRPLLLKGEGGRSAFFLLLLPYLLGQILSFGFCLSRWNIQRDFAALNRRAAPFLLLEQKKGQKKIQDLAELFAEVPLRCATRAELASLKQRRALDALLRGTSPA